MFNGLRLTIALRDCRKLHAEKKMFYSQYLSVSERLEEKKALIRKLGYKGDEKFD